MKGLRREIRRIAAVAMAVLVAGTTIPVHAVSMTGEADTALSGGKSTVSSGDAEEIISSVSGNGVALFAVNRNGGIDIADVDAGDAYGQIEINAGNVSDWDGKTLTGNTTDKSLIIKGVSVHLVIKDLSIDRSSVSSSWLPAIGITGGGSLYLTLEGTNYLHGATGGAGIWVNSGAALEITAESTGAVTAIGGNGYGGAAGIGAGGSMEVVGGRREEQYVGEICIAGGNVTAQGGSYTDFGSTRPYSGGAGIGGTYGASGAVIEITGGVVNAQGGCLAAGIGGGFAGSAGEITISGGTVTAATYEANGAMGAAIGNGIHAMAGTAYPFGKITISGGDVTAKGNVGFGSTKAEVEVYPDAGCSVTIAEGAYPKITGEINYGKSTAEGIVKYNFAFTVCDGRFTADTTAKVFLNGEIVGETVEAKVNTPGKAEPAFSITCGELTGTKTFTLTMDGREYSADVNFEAGKTDYSPVIGTQLYPVVLQIYDDVITADIEVAEVSVKQGGVELSRENGAYYAPDKISRISATYSEMVCYLPAGPDTEISVTATALNDGNAMEQTGYTVNASDNNRLCLKNREGLSLNAELNSVDVTSAKIKVALNKPGAETKIYYKASETPLAAEEIKNDADGSQTINGGEGEITLSGLKAYSENTCYFVAEQGGTLSQVTSLTIQTKRVAFSENPVREYLSYINTSNSCNAELDVRTNTTGATVYYLKSTNDENIAGWQDVVRENVENTTDAGRVVQSETSSTAEISLGRFDPATEVTYYFVAKKDDCYSDVMKYTFITLSSVVIIKPGETQEISCKSLADAVAVAKKNPGATVKLIKDQRNIKDGISVEEGNDFILDLNGKTLRFTMRNPICVSGGSLRVKGGGLLSSGLEMGSYWDAIFNVTGGELAVSGTTLNSSGVPYCRIDGEDAVVSFQDETLQCSRAGATVSLNVQQAKSLTFNNVTFNGNLCINNTPSVTLTNSTFKGDVLLDKGVLAGDTISGKLQLGSFTLNDYVVNVTDRTTGEDLNTLLQAGYVYQLSDSTTTAGKGSYSFSDVKVVPMTTLSGTLNITGGTGDNGTPAFGDTFTAEFIPTSGSASDCTYTWYRVKGSEVTELCKTASYTVQAGDVGAFLRCVVVNSAKTGRLEKTTETVVPKTLTDSNTKVTWNIPSYTYDGTEKEPEAASVQLGSTTLTAGTDYTVTYMNNRNAGTNTAKAIVTGIGAYQGSFEKPFSIEQKEVTVSGITAISRRYDGTTAAVLAYSSVVIGGKLEDDSLAVRATGNYTDEKAGEGKTVNITDITLTGASASNYKLAASGQQTTATADIFALPVKIEEVPSLGGVYGTAVENMSTGGGRVVDEADTTKEISGTWAVSDVNRTDVPKVGATTEYELIFVPSVEGVYQTVTCHVVPWVSKKPIKVTINDAARKFGEQNPAFTCTIPEGELVPGDTENAVQITLTTTAEKSSVAGSYYIKGTYQSDNYQVSFLGSASGAGILNVTKADAPVIPEENQGYCYIVGSGEGVVTVNVAEKLPEDRGTTTYHVGGTDVSGILDGTAKVDVDGVLSYKVKGSLETDKIGAKAIIDVAVGMQNYGDVTYRLTLTIVDKITVEEKSGNEVAVAGSNVLTYGQKLSELSLNAGGSNGAVFVEAGTSRPVAGTLTWKDPDEIPVAGTTTAAWVFTPADSVYETAQGTVPITVNRAEPAVAAAPTVAGRIYHPDAALTDGDLIGGSVKHTIGGVETDVPGTWSWQKADIVPTADNMGYVAVFTPDDTKNYEPVTRTIPVAVEKVTPYVSGIPSATAIVYGAALERSALSGGAVQYSQTDAAAVKGSFVWKDGTVRPTVADSDVTEYAVVFTPEDAADYEKVEVTVKVTVKKSAATPNMPGNIMNLPYSTKKVSGSTLPEGWTWQAADQDRELTAGVTVNATAVYTAADKGNYETESVVIAITRSACEHGNAEVRDAVDAACNREGYTGDSYCKDCGILISNGTATAALEHDYKAEVTKEATTSSEGVRTYTCTRCGDSYTQPIPKLPETPSDTSTADAPYIKGDSGKNGWDVIKDQLTSAGDNTTINVIMNGTTTVPGNVFDVIKGKDINIVLDMGNGVTWSVNGKDITADKVKDIDFGVKAGSEANNTIPVDVLNRVTGERYSVNLSLSYTGEFGLKAVITMNVKAENAGLYANLYYYNGQTGALEFICSDKIAADGTVRLTFTHASEYTVVIDKKSGEENSSTRQAPATGEDWTEEVIDPKSQRQIWLLGAGALIVIGMCVFFIEKSRKCR